MTFGGLLSNLAVVAASCRGAALPAVVMDEAARFKAWLKEGMTVLWTCVLVNFSLPPARP